MATMVTSHSVNAPSGTSKIKGRDTHLKDMRGAVIRRRSKTSVFVHLPGRNSSSPANLRWQPAMKFSNRQLHEMVTMIVLAIS